jgi:hypothetical protein
MNFQGKHNFSEIIGTMYDTFHIFGWIIGHYV